MKLNRGVAAALALMLASATSARAAEVTFLCSNALKSTMQVLAAQFEKSTEHKLKISFGSTDPLKARMEKGEAFDVAVVGASATDALIKEGKLDGATRVVLARSGLGIAIRKGAPKPDVGTTEAFKKTLLAAKSISYNEKGLTGDYLKVLFQRLGIADAVKSKFKNGSGAELVGKGESEIGISQASEVELVSGAELGGVLPAEIQNYSVFPAAVAAHAQHADAAKALLKFLTSPEAVKVMKAKGLEPGS